VQTDYNLFQYFFEKLQLKISTAFSFTDLILHSVSIWLRATENRYQHWCMGSCGTGKDFDSFYVNFTIICRHQKYVSAYLTAVVCTHAVQPIRDFLFKNFY